MIWICFSGRTMKEAWDLVKVQPAGPGAPGAYGQWWHCGSEKWLVLTSSSMKLAFLCESARGPCSCPSVFHLRSVWARI